MDDLRTNPACEADQSTEVERVIALVMKAIEDDIRRVDDPVNQPPGKGQRESLVAIDQRGNPAVAGRLSERLRPA